ncbi:MAG: hypothetical protein H7A37_00240 [Chlamydiales bacterium]|nr:hypothetical protein [Chlamydiia bacterium]MCP5506723.1 hypothetical protein [Chlamydiales bacterium]
MRPVLFLASLVLLLLSTGCCCHHVRGNLEYLSIETLASYHVCTPDPLRHCPPIGQRLVVTWGIPKPYFSRYCDLHINLSIIYRNHQTAEVQIPVDKRTSYYVYDIVNEAFCETGGILTFKLELVGDGCLLDEWKHQLWIKLITIDEWNIEEPIRNESMIQFPVNTPEYINTGNRNKRHDFEAIFSTYDIDPTYKKMDINEIDTSELEKIAAHKATTIFNETNEAYWTEDSSLNVDGVEGHLIRTYMEQENGAEDFANTHHGKKVTWTSCIAFYDETSEKVFVYCGTLLGTIADEPQGEAGYGFDSIIIPEGKNKTLSQLKDEVQDNPEEEAKLLSNTTARGIALQMAITDMDRKELDPITTEEWKADGGKMQGN